MAQIAEITVPAPPALSPVEDGQETQGQAYSLHLPTLASEPLGVTAGGYTFTWRPTELAYRDGAGEMDYIVGSSPVSVATRSREARYSRVFPAADDVFVANPEQVKHWTILNEPPRPPAAYLGDGVEFGVSGIIGGVPLPPGVHESIEVWGFTLPRPVARDLERREVVGRYEVVDSSEGQVLFVWFPASFFLSEDTVYPVMVDPTITTSTSASATALPTQNKVIHFPGGTSAVFWMDGTSVRMGISQDGFESPATVTTVATNALLSAGCHVVRDSLDRIHLVYVQASDDMLPVHRLGTPTNQARTTFSWSGTVALGNEPTGYHAPVMVQAPNGNDTRCMAFWSRIAAGNALVYLRDFTVTNAGSVNLGSGPLVVDGGASTGHMPPAVATDSNHHAHVAWSHVLAGAGRGVRSRRATWSAGVWTWQSVEAVTESVYATQMGNVTADSQGRALVTFRGSDTMIWVLRKPVGGSWADLSPVVSVGTGASPVTEVDSLDDLHLFYLAAGLQHRKRTASWSGPTTLDATANLQHLTAARNLEANAIAALYTAGSGSPYTVTLYRLGLNQPPNLPTNLTRTNFDAATAALFTWQHNDPDPGDGQSAYRLQILRVSDSVVVVDTGKTVASQSQHTLPASTLANGVNYQWRVRTWDQMDLEGPWSDYAAFTCSTAPMVTITSPTAGGQVSSGRVTVHWTFSDPGGFAQAQYRVRVYNATRTQTLWDSGNTTSVNARSLTAGYDLENSVNYQAGVQAANSAGIWGSEVYAAFGTAFTAPRPALDLSVIGDNAIAAIKAKWRRGTKVLSTFARSSTAYKSDGSLVASGQPRYEAGLFGQAILPEEATTNLLTANQSSVETDTTGFSATTGASISRTTDRSWSGNASLRVVTTGGAAEEGMQTTAVASAVNAVHTASARINGSGTVRLRVRVNYSDATFDDVFSGTVTLTDADWQRVSATVTPNGAKTVTGYALHVRTPTAQATTFYVDGLQIEQKAYPTSWHIGGATRAIESLTVPTAGITPAGFCWRQWVYIDAVARRSAGWNRVFRIPRASGGTGMELTHVNGGTAWRLATRNDSNAETFVDVPDSHTPDGWHLFEVKAQAAQAVLTIDSVPRGTIPNPNLPTAFDATAFIGSNQGTTEFLNTKFDTLQLLNYYPTDEESAAAYNSAQDLQWTDGTVALYRWDGDLEGGTQNQQFGDVWRVERRVPGGAWLRLANVPNPDSGLYTEYDDYAAASGQVYEYRVVAVGSNGTEQGSGVESGSVTREAWWFVPRDNPELRIPFAFERTADGEDERDITETRTRGRWTVHGSGGMRRQVLNIQAAYVDQALTDAEGISLTLEEWRQRFMDLVLVQGYLLSPDGLALRGILEPPRFTYQRNLITNPTMVAVTFKEKGPIP